MATLFVDKIDPQSGTSLEIGSSGDTITIPSGATITNNGTQTGFGGTNTPSFSAYKPSVQADLSPNQYNKITFTTEEFDPDSVYDASNSKFVAPSSGKYFFNTLIRVDPDAVGPTGMSLSFYKNGSLVRYNRQYNEDTQSCEIQMMINLAQNDYVEVYLYYHDDNYDVMGDTNNSIFQGFKLIT